MAVSSSNTGGTVIINFQSPVRAIEFDEESTVLEIIHRTLESSEGWIFDLSEIDYIGAWFISRVLSPLVQYCQEKGKRVGVVEGKGIKAITAAIFKKDIPFCFFCNVEEAVNRLGH